MLSPSIFRSNFVDDLFDDMLPGFQNGFFGRSDVSMMKTDVKDMGKSYQLEMEMPGVSKENIQAELKDGYLTITATQNHSNDEKDNQGNYIRRERYRGSCKRSFYVGEYVKQEDIKAGFQDGILKIEFPKQEEKPAVDERKFISIQ